MSKDGRRPTPQEETKIVTLYESGELTARAIAYRLAMGEKMVLRVLHRHGVPLRYGGQPGKWVRPNLRSKHVKGEEFSQKWFETADEAYRQAIQRERPHGPWWLDQGHSQRDPR